MNGALESITVIVPTLNERDNITPLVSRIFEQNLDSLPREVLFVDDGSTDGTCDCVVRAGETLPVRLLRRDVRLAGWPAACLGAHAARFRWIVIMDGDLSHPAERISDLIARYCSTVRKRYGSLAAVMCRVDARQAGPGGGALCRGSPASWPGPSPVCTIRSRDFWPQIETSSRLQGRYRRV